MDEFDRDDEYEANGSEEEYENIDISDYVSEGDDEIADYKLRDDGFKKQTFCKA